jgi:oligopeptide/dipeptide ABC transporter ATP-binding protein
MRQRVMIAMALACNPQLLIADEPTTALDVTIQAQILELMRTLRAELGTAIILITHDLGVIAELADEVIVMYAGKVIERCAAERLFAEPQHPYTVGLLGSIPRLHLERERLSAIEGFVPDAAALPPGCRFHPAMSVRDRQVQGRGPAARRSEAGPSRSVLARTAMSALLRAERLVKHFKAIRAGRRRQLRGRRGADARARRRVGLRQVDGGAAFAAADRADVGQGVVSVGAISSRCPSAKCGPCAERCRSSSRTRTVRSIRG